MQKWETKAVAVKNRYEQTEESALVVIVYGTLQLLSIIGKDHQHHESFNATFLWVRNCLSVICREKSWRLIFLHFSLFWLHLWTILQRGILRKNANSFKGRIDYLPWQLTFSVQKKVSTHKFLHSVTQIHALSSHTEVLSMTNCGEHFTQSFPTLSLVFFPNPKWISAKQLFLLLTVAPPP